MVPTAPNTSPDAASPNKVLIVGPSWVGDMIMAQSLFRQLQLLHPQLQIDVLAPAWSAALLARMPEVRNALELPFGHGELALGQRRRFGKALQSAGYDWAILLPNSFKSALIPFWAGIPRRSGFLGEQRYGLLNDWRRLDKQQLPMTVQRFVALAWPGKASLPTLELDSIPLPALAVKQPDIDGALAKHRLATDRPILALCPGAEYGPAKQWPARHYAALARHYLAQGWQVWVFGSQKDREIAGAIGQLATVTDLTGATALGEAIDLMSLATAVASNDSGLMHMAAALGRPVVGIYGSSDPRHTPPLGQHAATVSLQLDCSPCFQRHCPLGHTDCLHRLEPERVINQLNRLVAR